MESRLAGWQGTEIFLIFPLSIVANHMAEEAVFVPLPRGAWRAGKDGPGRLCARGMPVSLPACASACVLFC
jgi:hypothetical protein